METIAHLHLKVAAVGFLRRLGCQAVATEVRCPISRYRVDVAGYRDTIPVAERWDKTSPNPLVFGSDHTVSLRRGRRRCEPSTIVIECKRSRADFLRDRREVDHLLALRAELDGLRRHIEESQIKVHEPHLRRSNSSLFPELEDWDFAASRLRAYRQVVRRISRLERQLHGQTKFFTIARYQLADRLYLAVPRGMIRPQEVPCGWGLLECPQQWTDGSGDASGVFCSPPLRVTVQAPRHAPRPEHRIRLLRNLAVAACRTVGDHECVAADDGGAVCACE